MITCINIYNSELKTQNSKLKTHYLQKKVKFIIIILDIVARFIQQLVNLKQHIELLVIMQF